MTTNARSAARQARRTVGEVTLEWYAPPREER
jgi:hypothetical protein